MSQSILSNLPDHSRVWVYTASREFTNEEITDIELVGCQFVGTWKVHGKAIDAGLKVIYNRFIVIGANENVAGVSGCGIDSSVKFLKETENRFSVSLLDKLNLAYHSGSTIKVSPMMEFQQGLDSGEITKDTIVFNNLVENLGQLRTSWEVPLHKSWHKQLL